MKKFSIFLLMLSMAANMLAQNKSVLNEKNILNHMDVGVNVGTLGFGIDVAVPVGDYVRIRAGYNYMPRFTINSAFNVETSTGAKTSSFVNKFGSIRKHLTDNGIDINWPYFKEEKELMEQFENGNIKAKDDVSVGMKPNLHQFKFLVDVLPFKNNKHWSFTAGFFVGPSRVGDADNLKEETAILKAVNLYNNRYYNGLFQNRLQFQYIDGDGASHQGEIGKLTQFVTDNGLAGFTLGRFRDDGRRALMLPGEDATAHAEMKVSKIRPYIGVGYNTHLSKDKKWNLSVDAGVMFLCGAPSIYVDNVYKMMDPSPLVFDDKGNYVSGIGMSEYGFYYGDVWRYNFDAGKYDYVGEKVDHVDLVQDLKDIPGKAGDVVDFISKVKVYPNLSVGISYRIF